MALTSPPAQNDFDPSPSIKTILTLLFEFQSWKDENFVSGTAYFLTLIDWTSNSELILNRPFFVRFEGNSFCPKMAKLDFLPWNSIFSPENSNFRQFWANSTLQNIIWHKNLHGVTLFIAFLLSKFMGKGENLYLLALTYKILRKKLRNCFSERVKLVFKMLKLVFKMPKLVFKTPKLPSPAFH